MEAPTAGSDLDVARRNGLAGMEAYTQPDNSRMIDILFEHDFTLLRGEPADTLHWSSMFEIRGKTPPVRRNRSATISDVANRHSSFAAATY